MILSDWNQEIIFIFGGAEERRIKDHSSICRFYRTEHIPCHYGYITYERRLSQAIWMSVNKIRVKYDKRFPLYIKRNRWSTAHRCNLNWIDRVKEFYVYGIFFIIFFTVHVKEKERNFPLSHKFVCIFVYRKRNEISLPHTNSSLPAFQTVSHSPNLSRCDSKFLSSFLFLI